ncbi:MAG: histidine ammonia-lyase [Chloroflexi bacterium]|nr:histidine ammonia-lyase [Chloroflexota bacterium]
MTSYELNGTNLNAVLVSNIADAWENPSLFTLSISPDAVTRVERASQAIADFVRRGEIIYGVSTGFGDFKNMIIPSDQVKQLQRNILISHATGVGSFLPYSIVRAMMAVRVQTFLNGNSGIRLEVIDSLLQMINKGVYPLIPSQGSLGASGDLAPLAHMALLLIGEGHAYYHGEILPGVAAMQQADIPLIDPEAKEGLALTNGTSLMTAIGAITVHKACGLADIADAAAALSIEALRGTPLAFDERIHRARPHAGQIRSAANLRRLLDGSMLTRGFDPLDVQDPYSLRCSPQVHGAARDVIGFAKNAIEIELNSSTDNPLLFFDENGKAVCLSGGNFHGEPVAIPIDNLKVGLAELASISERRLARLVDQKENKNLLPAFLIREGGINSGFMMVQYTSAALVSENKVLAHPASVDSIPSSANTEDHVSMGTIAARQAAEIARNTENALALELFAAAQGIDFRLENAGKGKKLGAGTAMIYDLIRSRVPHIDKDVVMQPHIEEVRLLLESGQLLAAVRSVLNN